MAWVEKTQRYAPGTSPAIIGRDNAVLSQSILHENTETMRACFPDFIKLVEEVVEHIKAREEEKAEKQRQREEELRTPTAVLGNSYVQYIYVKKCWEQRAGYASVYISDPEMELARNAVRRIEQKMKPEVTGNWPTESMWQEADRRAQAMPFFSRNFTDQSKNCKDVLGWLLATYQGALSRKSSRHAKISSPGPLYRVRWGLTTAPRAGPSFARGAARDRGVLPLALQRRSNRSAWFVLDGERFAGRGVVLSGVQRNQSVYRYVRPFEQNFRDAKPQWRRWSQSRPLVMRADWSPTSAQAAVT